MKSPITMKPFPHDKLTDSLIDTLLRSSRFIGFMKSVVNSDVEISYRLSNQIINFINSTEYSVELGDGNARHFSASHFIDCLFDFAAIRRGYKLPESFLISLVRGKVKLYTKTFYSCAAVFMYLETYDKELPLEIKNLLDSDFHRFMLYMESNWSFPVTCRILKDPRVRSYAIEWATSKNWHQESDSELQRIAFFIIDAYANQLNL